MKIRSGFVSNSSSTSFALWGIEVPSDSDVYEKIRENYKSKLQSHTGLDDLSQDCCYIGLSPEEMKDDETLKEFKERVIQAIVKEGCPESELKDVKFYSDGGYDG